ncbi:MAG TPA: DUF1844 domain-containing protein [Terriglobales bacterium]|jgi:hypothetical protein
MAEKKSDTGFTVTDRRLFTSDGDLRQAEETAPPAQKTSAPAEAETKPKDSQVREDIPAPPTPAEQQQQKDAYQKSTRDLDSRVELGGHSARDFEMTFERFMASLYMTAMLQLGLMHEEGGQPRVDLIGARQTIDTISLLAEKTKGNLTPSEEGFLQNSLYELRMAYVEVTNALARPPQGPGAPAMPKSR